MSVYPTNDEVSSEGACETSLAVASVSKSFGGVHALTDVTLAVGSGEILGLIGENGAGKSTLIAVLSGATQPTAGTVIVDGRPIVLSTPLSAMAHGIHVVHQQPKLLEFATIAENIFLPRLARTRAWRPQRNAPLYREARDLLERLGLRSELPDVKTLAGQLTPAQRQLVAVAKALAEDSRVIFLDEPNSSLTERETAKLWELVERLQRDRVSVVVVSHRLRELYQVVTRIAVLRDGYLVGEGTTSEIDIAAAVDLMAGRKEIEAAAGARKKRSTTDSRGEVVLRLESVSTDAISNVDLELRRGQIVGLAGLVGSGRTEIARAIVGADRIRSGALVLDGSKVSFNSPRQARQSGVVMTSEERRVGLFAGHNVHANATASTFDRSSTLGVVNRGLDREVAHSTVERLNVRGTTRTPVLSLSGGNQQKVVIGRALATDPRVLILDEPTHGIDVRTKSDVASLVRSLADDGMAILYISSEVEELAAVADEIAVVRDGTVVSVHPATESTASIVASALGALESTNQATGADDATSTSEGQ